MAIAQRAGATVAGAGATVSTPGFNCQVNDVIAVSVAIRPTTGAVSSVGDTIGNSYTAGNSQSVNGTNVRIEEWWVISTGSNASNVVTVTPTGTTKFDVCAESYSGAGSIGNKGTATGSSVSPAITLTTQDANNWIAIAASAQGLRTYSATSPNVVRRSQQSSSGTSVTGAEGDAGAFAGTGSNTVTLTLDASNNWATAGIELRVPAGAPGPIIPLTPARTMVGSGT